MLFMIPIILGQQQAQKPVEFQKIEPKKEQSFLERNPTIAKVVTWAGGTMAAVGGVGTVVGAYTLNAPIVLGSLTVAGLGYTLYNAGKEAQASQSVIELGVSTKTGRALSELEKEERK